MPATAHNGTTAGLLHQISTFITEHYGRFVQIEFIEMHHRDRYMAMPGCIGSVTASYVAAPDEHGRQARYNVALSIYDTARTSGDPRCIGQWFAVGSD